IHVRDPETGNISHHPKLYREVVERIRDSKTDVVLNITAGGGGDWVPSEDDPTIGGEGTSMQTPKERHHPVEELLPEICTLDIGSINCTYFRKQFFYRRMTFFWRLLICS